MTTSTAAVPTTTGNFTAAQLTEIQSKVTAINGQLNTAYAAVQSALSNATAFNVVNTVGKTLGTNLATSTSPVGMLQQQLAQLQADLNSAIAQGQAVVNISTVPLTADAGRARYKLAVQDYQKMATAFLNECTTVQQTISNTTVAAPLIAAIKLAGQIIGEGLAWLANLAGEGLKEVVQAAVGAAVKNINLEGAVVLGILAWLVLRKVGAA